MMRINRAVKTGLLVTFIAASGNRRWRRTRVAPPPQFSAQDQAGPQGAGPGRGPDPQFQGQQAAARQNKAVGAVWARAYPQHGGSIRATRNPAMASALRSTAPPPPRVPPQLTVAPGTFFTVRVNQVLSSDHNQSGDAFSATLVKPIVVNGVVVADRGQVIQGRVSEAKKAGRVSGTSRLGLELTDLTLVDGSQVPVKTELVSRNGTTSEGRDAVGIGAATGIGAIIGAGAGGYHNAGRRRGHRRRGRRRRRNHRRAADPRQPDLSFTRNKCSRSAWITRYVISTDRAPQAFRYVGPYDYQQPRPAAFRAARAPSGGLLRPVSGLLILIMDTATRITTDPASASASAALLRRPLLRTLPSLTRLQPGPLLASGPGPAFNPPAPCCNTRAFPPPPPAFQTTPPSSPASAVLPFCHRRKSGLP